MTPTATPQPPTAIDPIVRTFDAPGATITYEVRSNPTTTEPPLLLIGSPMGAGGFTTLARYFADRTVVTYDPRTADRSRRTDGATSTEVAEHAEDLHRLIAEIGGGPVDIFASSGGATNALALVERHPDDVRTLVAHEPPSAASVPDRDAALAAVRDLRATYERRGHGVAMAKFILLVSHRGPIPADWTSQPDPDPAMFGMPAEDDGSRDDPLLGQNMPANPSYEFDVEALRRAPTRIVLAASEEGEGTLAHRGAKAVAESLGREAVIFPSNHGGFLGDEFGPGQGGKPAEFAAKLREVLAGGGAGAAS
jgi:pimeloyl-ACP methyl ester carboxylesterase